ncbi:nucleoside triphosphate pyrophosphohydrolase [bacterium]|nr:nucleoside triphosphate pyrophosphohydrolase [bacterium]
MTTRENPLSRLASVIAALRDPDGGCPWDLEQTHESLRRYVIEEAYEVVEAIEEAPEHLEEELGDLLLQIYLHAEIASEQQRFSVHSIAEKLVEKLIRRHPHVFGAQQLSTSEEVREQWEEIKSAERSEVMASASVLDGVPKGLPALLESFQIGKKVAKRNFDWESPGEILEKVNEECEEVLAEIETSDAIAIEEEVGDLLFTVAQLARKLGVEPEGALKKANRKFSRRYRRLEELEKGHGPSSKNELSRNEKEELWQRVKNEERDQ